MNNTDEEIVFRTEEEQKRSTEIFDSFRDELYKRQLSNSEAYDKAILSLSSAGLAISLSFIKFIVPLEQAKYICVLEISWLLFLVSVVTTLLSFLIGNKGISTQIKYAEQYYIEAKANSFNKRNIYSQVNSVFNYISGLLFVIALTCVVSFVILNIDSGETDMSKSKKTGISVNDSASIPSMQKIGGKSGDNISATIPPMERAPGSSSKPKSNNSGGQTGAGKPASNSGESKK